MAAADGTEEAALVYFGLIDVLTKWGARKAAEHVAKAAGAPARRNEISCVPPRQYGARFVRKMQGWLDVQVDVAPGASAHGTPAHGTPATPSGASDRLGRTACHVDVAFFTQLARLHTRPPRRRGRSRPPGTAS